MNMFYYIIILHILSRTQEIENCIFRIFTTYLLRNFFKNDILKLQFDGYLKEGDFCQEQILQKKRLLIASRNLWNINLLIKLRFLTLHNIVD